MVGERKKGGGEEIHPVRSNRKSNMAAQWTMALALPNKTPALQATMGKEVYFSLQKWKFQGGGVGSYLKFPPWEGYGYFNFLNHTNCEPALPCI